MRLIYNSKSDLEEPHNASALRTVCHSQLLVKYVMVLEDRASLLKRRQQIHRAKENASCKSNVSNQQAHEQLSRSADGEAGAFSTAPPRARKKSLVAKVAGSFNQQAVTKKTPTRITAPAAGVGAAEPNVALLVRQVLQRPHYGDLGEYLKTATKEQLFEQTLLIAKFTIEVGSSCWCFSSIGVAQLC